MPSSCRATSTPRWTVGRPVLVRASRRVWWPTSRRSAVFGLPSRFVVSPAARRYHGPVARVVRRPGSRYGGENAGRSSAGRAVHGVRDQSDRADLVSSWTIRGIVSQGQAPTAFPRSRRGRRRKAFPRTELARRRDGQPGDGRPPLPHRRVPHSYRHRERVPGRSVVGGAPHRDRPGSRTSSLRVIRTGAHRPAHSGGHSPVSLGSFPVIVVRVACDGPDYVATVAP